ncbi:MAG TPA: hypothetical protein V6C97_16235 [Oculatellaceae cyanobacterium]
MMTDEQATRHTNKQQALSCWQRESQSAIGQNGNETKQSKHSTHTNAMERVEQQGMNA